MECITLCSVPYPILSRNSLLGMLKLSAQMCTLCLRIVLFNCSAFGLFVDGIPEDGCLKVVLSVQCHIM